VKRGFTLLEALVSLALVLVVLGTVAAICRGVWRSQSFAAKKDLDLTTEIAMLGVARECAEAREWLSPPGSEVRLRKLNPLVSHDPPRDSDRLPAQPLPLPTSWSDDPGLRLQVRYYLQAGRLWRQQASDDPWEIAEINADFQADRQADGRITLRYSYAQSKRSITVMGILP
jgi:prepilin-type N-terminal cleavage/methylation domain-containing protein